MSEIDPPAETKPTKKGFFSKIKRTRDAAAAALITWAIIMAIIVSMTESEIAEKDYYELRTDLSTHPKRLEALPIAIKAAEDGKITYSERKEIYTPMLKYDKKNTPGSRESVLNSLKGSK